MVVHGVVSYILELIVLNNSNDVISNYGETVSLDLIMATRTDLNHDSRAKLAMTLDLDLTAQVAAFGILDIDVLLSNDETPTRDAMMGQRLKMGIDPKNRMFRHIRTRILAGLTISPM